MRFKAIILIAIFALLYSQVAYAKGVNNAVDEFTAFQNQLRAKANPANSEQGADGSSYYNNINENRPPPEKLLSFSVP